MNRMKRDRVDALIAQSFERAEEKTPEPARGTKPEYRLMGSAGTLDPRTEAGLSGDRRGSRGTNRQVPAFTFALMFFAFVAIVPAALSLRYAGFACIAAERVVGSPEMAEYGERLERGAALLGSRSPE